MDELSLLRVGIALLLVVGLITLSGWLAKRTGLSSKLSQQTVVRVIGKHSLGARTSVVVLEVPGAQLIVGVTPQSINLLHTIESDSTSAETQSPPASEKKDFAAIMSRLKPQKPPVQIDKVV